MSAMRPRDLISLRRPLKSVLLALGGLLVALFHPPLAAADSGLNPRLSGTPFLRAWEAEDYDASPVNWRVLVHPNGLVYVGNNSGVLEYDGARWRTRPMAHGGRASALAVDRRGRLWAGGHDEICVFEPDARGSLRAVDMTSLIPPADRPIGAIIRTLAMPDGVYLQSQQRLFRFYEVAGQTRVQVWRTPLRFYALFSLGGEAHTQIIKPQSPGLGLLRVAGEELVPVVATIAAVTGRTGRAFDARAQGKGWLLITATGPFRWDGNSGELQPLSAAATEVFSAESAVDGIFLSDGRMAFSMTRSGLVIFDAAGRIERRVHREHGLPNNRIEALGEDAEGGLWLALHYGLARLQLDSPFALHAAAQGIEGGPRRILRQWDRIYVAHSEGLSWRDPASGKFNAVAGLTIGANRLSQIGERLVVTSGGLKEVLRDAPVRPWWNRALFGVTEWRRQPGWIVAAASVGLTLFEPKADGWENLGPLANLPLDVETIHDSGDGWLWLATQAGSIHRVDFRRGLALEAPIEAFGREQGVPPPRRSENVQIFSLEGTVAISSSEWLLRYDPAAGRFVPETRMPGFGATRGATLVHPTADGGLWLRGGAPSYELLRVSPQAAGAWPLRQIEAGPLRHLIANSIYEDTPAQTLWIAGQGSLVSLALDWKPLRAPPPLRVHVRSMETGTGELLAAPVIGGPGDLRPALQLTSAQTALRLEFAAPTYPADFRGTLRTQYRTRLDGFADAWTDWTTETHRDFTGLPYRALTFRVQARDLEGRLSAETTLSFAIAAPWWLTRWAVGSYIALLGLGVVGVVKFRTHALRRANARLARVVAERTATLDQQNQELTRLHQLELDEKTAAQLSAQLAQLAEEKTRLEMLRYQLNPHFLYNTLYSLYSVVGSHPEAGPMVLSLSSFCRLTLTRGNEVQSVADEFEMLRLYLDIEKFRWGDRLAITISADAVSGAQLIPPFLLLPLVENAIKHGLRTSRDGVALRVSAQLRDRQVAIEIANSGRWSDTPAPGIVSTGIGLGNIRQRLQRHYPEAHTFTIGQEGDWVVARLRFPAVDHPAK